MQASSWLEQEQLDERMAELEAQKAALAADLQAAHAELAAARQAAAVQDATLRKLSEQLLKEGEAAAKLKVQLAREQGLVKSLRAKMNKVTEVAVPWHAGCSTSIGGGEGQQHSTCCWHVAMEDAQTLVGSEVLC